ncbi:MAG: methyl-accepting chemotaxis protein [Rhodothermaceae bacterium]
MKEYWKKMTIKYKMILPITFVAIVTGVFTYQFFVNLNTKNEIRALVNKAKSLILVAESAREYTTEQNELNVFKEDMSDLEQILRTVPIFSTIRVAKNKAKELNMEIKVPKVSPRNPDNEPDAFELRVLDKFKKEKLAEYYEIDEATNKLRYFRPVILSEDCLKCHGDPARSFEYWGRNDGKDVTGTQMENWRAGEVHGAIEVFMDMAPMQADIASNSFTIALISVVSVVLFILIVLFVSRTISKPIERIGDVADAIAVGDLTKTVEIDAEDELGKLSGAINKFISNLYGIVSKLKNNGDSISGTTQNLAGISTTLMDSLQSVTNQSATVAGATEQVSTNMSSMAATAEEMSINVENVVNNATQVSDSTVSVASSIDEVSSTISMIANNSREAADISDQAARMSSEASQTMVTLGEAANEIGKVTEVIKRIADQTNLLALNATIEAASAGEAGKGFAVVANEIKELANQSARAAEDIADKISSVQDNTTGAVEIITQVAEIILTINNSVNEISSSVDQQSATISEVASSITQTQMDMKDLANNMEEVSVGVNDLSKSTSEAAKGTDDVAASITMVNDATISNNQGAQDVMSSVETLTEVASDLVKIVEGFKLNEN